jgi:hypothetical protein
MLAATELERSCSKLRDWQEVEVGVDAEAEAEAE